MFLQISILQWVFIIWILLLFLKSIIALFDKEAPDEILFGVILILGGGLWLMQSYWVEFSLPWISWLQYFRVEILIAILLVMYGIRLAFRPPWKHIILIAVVVAAFMLIGHLQLPEVAQRDQSVATLSKNSSMEGEKFVFDASEIDGDKLELTMERGNFSLFTGDTEDILKIKDVDQVERKGDSSFAISSVKQRGEIAIHENIKKLFLEARMGNMNGAFFHSIDEFFAKTNMGDLNLSFSNALGKCRLESNMGNVSVMFNDQVKKVEVKSNAGNINLNFSRGTKVNADELETRLGNITINDGDGSSGEVVVKGRVNLGNITINSD